MKAYLALSLILMATKVVAADLSSGKYRGEIGNNSVEASVTLLPDKRRSAALLTNSPRCTGHAEFPIEKSDDAFVGSPGEGCTITLNSVGGKLFVTEDHCEFFHGAECNFEGVLKMISNSPAAVGEYKTKATEKIARLVSQASAAYQASSAASDLKTNSSNVVFDQAAEAYLRKDYISAIRAFRSLAAQGDARGQTMLATMYREGIGVGRDYSQSLYWYRKAADQGAANAQYHLGWMYAEGIGISSDMHQAIVWYQRAAKQDYVKAQYNLGLIYGNGRGVEQDFSRAASFYLAAAEQGDAGAQTNLGVMYAKGLGVSLDSRQAAGWYQRAAEQGDADAQNNLGAMYASGRGVPTDWVQAYMWFYLSANAGDQKGAANLLIADSKIDVDQVERAKVMARNWKPCQSAQGRVC